MKRSALTAVAMSFGLFASMTGAQTASAMVAMPMGASAGSTSQAAITEVQFRHYGGFRGWHRGYRPGYRWRSGYGWVPLAIGGAIIAGAVAGAYSGPGPYPYGPAPYAYGPGPYGPAPYGPGPYDGPRY